MPRSWHRSGWARLASLERPSQGLHGPLDDLVRLAAELLRPTLVCGPLFAEATTVAFPGLKGVLPGVGAFDPLDWGLGFELRDAKTPHWTGERNSPATFGHFGGSGTFLWVDPGAGLALAVLTDREFGPWALEAWPALSDAVLEASGADLIAGGSVLRDRSGGGSRRRAHRRPGSRRASGTRSRCDRGTRWPAVRSSGEPVRGGR